MSDNMIVTLSFDFAVKIVELFKQLYSEKREFVLSKQLLRAGTSIGANVAEAQRGQSKVDFISKMNIALKEANETDYWLRLLNRTGYISEIKFTEMKSDIVGVKNLNGSIYQEMADKLLVNC